MRHPLRVARKYPARLTRMGFRIYKLYRRGSGPAFLFAVDSPCWMPLFQCYEKSTSATQRVAPTLKRFVKSLRA